MSLDVGADLNRADGLDANDFEKMYNILNDFVFNKDCGNVRGSIADLVDFFSSLDGVSPEAKRKFQKLIEIFTTRFHEHKEAVAGKVNEIKKMAAWGAYALRNQEESIRDK